MTTRHEHEPTVYQESSGPSMAVIVSVVAIIAVVVVALLLFDANSGGGTQSPDQNAPAPSIDLIPPSA